MNNGKKASAVVSFCAIVSLAFFGALFGGAAGCGSSTSRAGASGTIGTSSGTLTTPDGTPVAGAAVVVSSSSAASLKLKNAAGHPIHSTKLLTDDESETCEDIEVTGTVRGSDCTDSRGDYSLAYDVEVECGDTVTFTAKKGGFSISLNLTITCAEEGDDQDVAFDDFEFDDDCGVDDEGEALVLSGGKFPVSAECTSDDSGIARMAVCYGDYDNIQDVLAKLGFAVVDDSTGQWDGDDSTADFDFFLSTSSGDAANPDGTDRPSCCDLLQGETVTNALGEEKTIDDYDIVFLNCGNGCDEPDADGGLTFSGVLEDALLDPTAQTTIQDWVESGGRLYVTDLSYDFVEQNFPSIVDFA